MKLVAQDDVEHIRVAVVDGPDAVLPAVYPS
jgi:hypothetical protein